MKIKCVAIGKTKNQEFINIIKSYIDKIEHYINFEFIIINDIKSAKNKKFQKNKEAELILSKIDKNKHVIVLDEKGKEYNSISFSNFIQHHMNSSKKEIIFIIGGAYGLSEKILERANQKVSLSKMTFSHQMVRIIFLEQLYRSFSILKNEPYHNN
ncbi:MAG TPA: 23S rRNA (pseudouridine(1915)-N(3))-methyltransferase RlmH [Flavobacteriaceae bacterium]|nr:23S rRNA (pseudouridine(1915)-N(3))-methyltransferase RlmH [Flavobacteriaceae bacterium]|tara:strand:- start:1054 stop:1521 length:468 start_codon:yes stop_codon:yes gene_type:complete